MNPILSPNHFVPDSEAHVWKDGRLYIYGSYDNCGDSCYCSTYYHVFSTDDMVNWVDHGESFDSLTATSIEDPEKWEFNLLYAPDCAYKDGKYYLFFCQSDSQRCEGVAVSDKPYGPFEDTTYFEAEGIDPTILIDDDGEAYYFWGQFSLNGAKLTPDLRSIDKSTMRTDLLTEKEHGFHEGSSICKYNGLYYMLFADTSRGKATCLSYAVSEHPLGPYEKRGVVIDNDGCDPHTWNNHGSLCEYKGQWYIFYHRSSQNAEFNRRACVEPIFFDENGDIAEVEMTTQGAEKPLCAGNWLGAGRACYLNNRVYIGYSEFNNLPTYPSVISNTTNDAVSDSADNTTTAPIPYEYLCNAHYGDFTAYKYLDFGDDTESYTRFVMHAACPTYDGKIDIYIDAPDDENGRRIGTCYYKRSDTGWFDWKEYSCEIEPVNGVHAVYLRFTGRYSHRQANVLDFRFE